MDDDRYQKLKDFALRFLSFRPRSVKEIRGRLMQFSIKRGIPTKVVEAVISDLTSKGLVNDEEFVRWWIEQRHTFRKKGIRAIRLELLEKGVARETIEQVILAETDKDKELALARQVAAKKISFYSRLPKEEIKRNIGSLLARRGFDWEIIYKVIDSLLKKS